MYQIAFYCIVTAKMYGSVSDFFHFFVIDTIRSSTLKLMLEVMNWLLCNFRYLIIYYKLNVNIITINICVLV